MLLGWLGDVHVHKIESGKLRGLERAQKVKTGERFATAARNINPEVGRLLLLIVVRLRNAEMTGMIRWVVALDHSAGRVSVCTIKSA